MLWSESPSPTKYTFFLPLTHLLEESWSRQLPRPTRLCVCPTTKTASCLPIGGSVCFPSRAAKLCGCSSFLLMSGDAPPTHPLLGTFQCPLASFVGLQSSPSLLIFRLVWFLMPALSLLCQVTPRQLPAPYFSLEQDTRFCLLLFYLHFK